MDSASPGAMSEREEVQYQELATWLSCSAQGLRNRETGSAESYAGSAALPVLYERPLRLPRGVEQLFNPSEDPAHLTLIDADLIGSVAGVGVGPALVCLCSDPEVYLFRNSLPGPLCAQLGNAQGVRSYPATVHRDGVGSVVDLASRDAQVYSIDPSDFCPWLKLGLGYLAQSIGGTFSQLEPLQVVSYGVGQKFTYHMDYFSDEYLTSPAGVAMGGQRTSSIIIYLNDDYQGGETAFPELGFKVRGQTGDTLLFKNTILNRIADNRTRHAGLPVTSGKKHIGVSWVRQRCPLRASATTLGSNTPNS